MLIVKEQHINGSIKALDIINKAQNKRTSINRTNFDWRCLESVRVYLIERMIEDFALFAKQCNSKGELN